MIIFDADDPRVLDGTYDREGFTPAERRALDRKRLASAQAQTMPDSFTDINGIWRCLHCGLVQPCGQRHATPPPPTPPRRKDTMSNLFDNTRVGVYLDLHTPRLKKSKKTDDEIHVLDLKLRVQPLTTTLAHLLEGVRPVLFRLDSAEPVANLTTVGFKIQIPRQQFHLFASSDTEKATLMLDHVEVSGWKATQHKDVDGWALTFRATIGPVSREELEYVHAWYTQQRFLECLEAEPSLDFDDATDDADDDDDEPPAPPPPMWGEGGGDGSSPEIHADGSDGQHYPTRTGKGKRAKPS